MGLDRRVRPQDAVLSPAGATADDKTGLLIIKTWMERGSPAPLRAQIRLSTDVSAGFERTLTVLRAEDVHAAVQTWLEDIMGAAES